MPYGLTKAINTPANNAKMEICVDRLVSKGTDKIRAIRICKAAIQKHAMKGMNRKQMPAGTKEEQH